MTNSLEQLPEVLSAVVINHTFAVQSIFDSLGSRVANRAACDGCEWVSPDIPISESTKPAFDRHLGEVLAATALEALEAPEKVADTSQL